MYKQLCKSILQVHGLIIACRKAQTSLYFITYSSSSKRTQAFKSQQRAKVSVSWVYSGASIFLDVTEIPPQ